MNGWERVTRNNPCPVCGKTDNCCVTDDGGAAWCGRVSSETVNNGGQFLHILKEKESRELPAPGPARAPRYFTVDAKLCWAESDLADINRLAVQLLKNPDILYLRPRAFKGLLIGYVEKHWTIPERDENGDVIGICRRYEDGSKFMLEGGKRGLIYSRDWYEYPGPVYCPEGFTDVAALKNIGFCAVGRPSCSGGIEMLGNLLRRSPSGKRVIILGENDHKPHETLKDIARERHDPECLYCMQCWPGKWGAQRTALMLAKKLTMPIAWVMPPAEFKDTREWLSNGVSRDPERLVNVSDMNWELP